MKTILLSAVAALALGASAATAGGLSDPAPTPITFPAVDLSWTGAYAGLSANTDFDDATVGGFVGYRWDLGDAVVGGELNVVDNAAGSDVTYSAEAQLGYDLGSFLPYVSAGYQDNGVSDGEVFGVGLDYAFANDVLVGVKYTDDDFSGSDGNLSFRVGFSF